MRKSSFTDDDVSRLYPGASIPALKRVPLHVINPRDFHWHLPATAASCRQLIRLSVLLGRWPSPTHPRVAVSSTATAEGKKCHAPTRLSAATPPQRRSRFWQADVQTACPCDQQPLVTDGQVLDPPLAHVHLDAWLRTGARLTARSAIVAGQPATPRTIAFAVSTWSAMSGPHRGNDVMQRHHADHV